MAGYDDNPDDDVVHVEITDELDLHTFHPREVKGLVADYLDECVARGFEQVRIVHGKGTGTLRAIVHAVLDRHPAVIDYRLGGEGAGSWGATLVRLRLSAPGGAGS
jgi:dsDNA-specific endonuclease/ATPase MutS2